MGIFDQFAAEFASESASENEDTEVTPPPPVEMDEVEKRLSKAAFYKFIAKNGVVEEDGSGIPTEVNEEVQTWARTQMGKLLGIADETKAPEPIPVVLPFNEKEIGVLKKVAERLLLAQGERPTDPIIKKNSNNGVGPRPKAPTPSPKAPPPASKKKPAPKAAPQKAGSIDYDSIPMGEPFTDADGQVYKKVENPHYDSSVEGAKPWIKRKLTSQVRAQGGIAMPTGAQLESIMHTKSVESVNNISVANPVFPDKDSSQKLLITAAAKSLANS